MTKAEIMEFILEEAEDYRRIAVERDEQYGPDSVEALVALAKYRALWLLAKDIGAEQYMQSRAAKEA